MMQKSTYEYNTIKKLENVAQFNNDFHKFNLVNMAKSSVKKSVASPSKSITSNKNYVISPRDSGVYKNANNPPHKLNTEEDFSENNHNYDNPYNSSYSSKFPKNDKEYKKELNHKLALDKSSNITDKLKQEIKNFKKKANFSYFSEENTINNDKNNEKYIVNNDLEKSVCELKIRNEQLTQEIRNIKMTAQIDSEISQLRTENRTTMFDNKILRDDNEKLNDLVKNYELEL